VAGDEDVLSACPVEREEQTVEGTVPILHYRATRYGRPDLPHEPQSVDAQR